MENDWTYSVERRLEIYSERGWNNLSISSSRWREIINEIGLHVISEMGSEFWRAYLLQESSLIIFPRQLILVTCGSAKPSSLVKMLDLHVTALKYSVTELCQRTLSNEDDVDILLQKYPSAALVKTESSLELQFGMVKEVKKFIEALPFVGESLPVDVDQVLEMLKLQMVAEKLSNIHYSFFCPWGFSLNAITRDAYLMVHASRVGGRVVATIETNGLYLGQIDRGG